ncbi:hypothetical protein HYH03_017201 [Edaphochlamys debaryana]|uniref:Uncharacterized protein n=1 Tax=Edaphochlamys debaryana TaxID=47281 RepID=A0A836BPC9_9CHLO|nr:hypothetical protein HYH03_017201 [Edaphochlamys debaryana]|eukprot:KAG2483955.1 hypothetical protein HYH03_017201 [Edaphochlamys debaryana]
MDRLAWRSRAPQRVLQRRPLRMAASMADKAGHGSPTAAIVATGAAAAMIVGMSTLYTVPCAAAEAHTATAIYDGAFPTAPALHEAKGPQVQQLWVLSAAEEAEAAEEEAEATKALSERNKALRKPLVQMLVWGPVLALVLWRQPVTEAMAILGIAPATQLVRAITDLV